ncbi:MAG TPA: GNAT family protein [Candidatus Hydrogenedentes bacterium]|nr:GNAT family protein [Candidatus Hydrogenedentota bacterium]HRK34339.1 GNAT family protein [Candidatus Hydrogenedentota bacterium]
MISGKYTIIRSAEPDDAYAMWRLYDPSRPRSFLLGPSREVMIPTQDEMREMLARRDVIQGSFFAIEDRAGEVLGCCVLRGAKAESDFAEVVVALTDESSYDSPVADEVYEFLKKLGFVDKKLNKLVAHCLCNETGYRAFLVRHGFTSDGIQREMVYTKGRYFDLESLSLFNNARTGGGNGSAVAAP